MKLRHPFALSGADGFYPQHLLCGDACLPGRRDGDVGIAIEVDGLTTSLGPRRIFEDPVPGVATFESIAGV